MTVKVLSAVVQEDRLTVRLRQNEQEMTLTFDGDIVSTFSTSPGASYVGFNCFPRAGEPVRKPLNKPPRGI